MVNHWYDWDKDATRCGDYEGLTGWAVSANDRVSCPDCFKRLAPTEKEGQWYGESE